MWDRKRVIIATWLTEYFWLSIYAFAEPVDIKFILRVSLHEIMREGTMVRRTAGRVTDSMHKYIIDAFTIEMR